MINVVIAFHKVENAKSIKNILVKNGIDVTAVYTSTAQVIMGLHDMDETLVICGYRFPDMMYHELKTYLPDVADMLLIASKNNISEEYIEDVEILSMPIKVYELVDKTNSMLDILDKKRVARLSKPKERSPEEKALINKAKEYVMKELEMSEFEAHRYLQKRSMNSGMGIVGLARKIVDKMEKQNK